jgi:hypothetical protein
VFALESLSAIWTFNSLGLSVEQGPDGDRRDEAL